MNIVIIGAGDIGLHLATILSQADYGIVLVDIDPYKLAAAARELDVATRCGSGTDWQLLQDLLEFAPDLFIALTDHDETNLVACALAKNLGYKQTIARVRAEHYFAQSRLNFERIFCADYLIGPEILTAEAIGSMILMPNTLSAAQFAQGAIEMGTMTVPATWQHGTVSLAQRAQLGLPESVMVGLIHRKEQLIFPHGKDTLQAADVVTFVGQRGALEDVSKFLNLSAHPPRGAIIVGGSRISIYLARLLHQHGLRITLLEPDFTRCRALSEELPFATLLNRSGTDMTFLEAEKGAQSEVFVACTPSDETNFLSGTIAKHLGCQKVIVVLSDTHYAPLAEQWGVFRVASARVHAANRILTIAREKSVTSLVSLYDKQAEIMEVKISAQAKIAGIPLRLLGPELPKNFLIAAIQSRGRVFIADGSRILSPGDTAIIITCSEHMKEIRELF